jgi:hypothetical protein
MSITNNRRKVADGTMNISMAARPSAWLRRKLRQVADGECGRRSMTEAFPWDTAPRFLLRDRDSSYGAEFSKRVDAMRITEVLIAPHSPWCTWRRSPD